MSSSKDVSKVLELVSALREDSAYTRGVLESLLKEQTLLRADVDKVKAEQNKMKGGVVVVSALVGGLIAFLSKLFFQRVD